MPVKQTADYEQLLLLPPAVEDWVGPEHPARFIRVFVDTLDLEALGVDWGNGATGCPPYPAHVLLKVWLYGYFFGVKSTRRLEAMCRDNMGLVWLARLAQPDHNTLWRFYRQNKSLLRAMFRQSVVVANDAQMVGLVLQALDGTKIQALASNASGLHRQRLERVLAAVTERLAVLEKAIESNGEQAAAAAALPEALQDVQQLHAQVLESMAKLEAAGLNHLNPNDPDARVMKLSDRKMNSFAYNGQAVVDADSRVLVAQDISQSPSDSGQLSAMLEQVQEELGTTAQTTLADQGYAVGADLQRVQEQGHNVLVHLPAVPAQAKDKPFHACHFAYDAVQDEVICPRGERLAYTHTREHTTRGYTLRCYRCHNKECPVRSQCTTDSKGRKVEINQYHDVVTRQRQAQDDPEKKATLAKRCWLIEPVFGWMKAVLGFRRFTAHGLENAKTQWALICATYNLHILYRAWKANQQPDPLRGHAPSRPKCLCPCPLTSG